jgi:hypothetical protein
LIKIFCF